MCEANNNDNQQPNNPYNNNQPRVNLKTYVYNPQIKASLLCVTLLKLN